MNKIDPERFLEKSNPGLERPESSPKCRQGAEARKGSKLESKIQEGEGWPCCLEDGHPVSFGHYYLWTSQHVTLTNSQDGTSIGSLLWVSGRWPAQTDEAHTETMGAMVSGWSPVRTTEQRPFTQSSHRMCQALGTQQEPVKVFMNSKTKGKKK